MFKVSREPTKRVDVVVFKKLSDVMRNLTIIL